MTDLRLDVGWWRSAIPLANAVVFIALSNVVNRSCSSSCGLRTHSGKLVRFSDTGARLLRYAVQ